MIRVAKNPVTKELLVETILVVAGWLEGED